MAEEQEDVQDIYIREYIQDADENEDWSKPRTEEEIVEDFFLYMNALRGN